VCVRFSIPSLFCSRLFCVPAQYRTGALDEQSPSSRLLQYLGVPRLTERAAYHANFAVWQQIRLNGYSFRDVSNLKLKSVSHVVYARRR
jgi:hypothetical protein